MGTKEWTLEQLQKLWRLVSEVLEFEVDFKWLDSTIEDDSIRVEEKTRQVRVRFLKICIEFLRHVKKIKNLLNDVKNGSLGRKEESETAEGSGDSKGNDV